LQQLSPAVIEGADRADLGMTPEVREGDVRDAGTLAGCLCQAPISDCGDPLRRAVRRWRDRVEKPLDITTNTCKVRCLFAVWIGGGGVGMLDLLFFRHGLWNAPRCRSAEDATLVPPENPYGRSKWSGRTILGDLAAFQPIRPPLQPAKWITASNRRWQRHPQRTASRTSLSRLGRLTEIRPNAFDDRGWLLQKLSR